MSIDLREMSEIDSPSQQLYIGEACWAFVFGVIVGKAGCEYIQP